ncbi:MAG: hypothetical protein EOP83_09595 [Verrucomicrobiaceae bacterium]|nr:MAG: hypothetical protein EOP83_09595 [Verrucomicrobiaceae bacterium]
MWRSLVQFFSGSDIYCPHHVGGFLVIVACLMIGFFGSLPHFGAPSWFVSLTVVQALFGFAVCFRMITDDA